MRIRILRASHGHADGIDLRSLQVGSSYDVSPALGAKLVNAHDAELVSTLEPMMLVQIPPDPHLPATRRSLLSPSSRESLLSFDQLEP